MVTFIISSRVKDNPDSNIFELLDSILENGYNENNCEVLIKYDDDDDERPTISDFTKYPFTTKIFIWSRMEGRHSLHLTYFQLFNERNPKSKFIINCPDDRIFFRKGFVDEILSIKKKYCFIGNIVPSSELIKSDYHKKQNIKIWIHQCDLLVTSCKIIEILGNFGFQSNTDNWMTLLHLVLVSKYNLDLFVKVENFNMRNNQINKSYLNNIKNYNEIFRVDDTVDFISPNYFKLIEQQAKNIYLNYKEDNGEETKEDSRFGLRIL